MKTATKTTRPRQKKADEILNLKQAASLLGWSPATFARQILRDPLLAKCRVRQTGQYRYSEYLLLKLKKGELR